ncbi:MAG: CinA family nicotinamide mononucleotide deamidase-related protein, partial [Desulfobacteraceae bacterium]|nr:CinA family nicotinamide mononucleotide deamidase-related protein [Desulfobacteraceae bacterium]
DEVLLGDLVDTNSGYLCDRLKQTGIVVSQITAIGDDVDAVAETVLRISRRARLCLVTGGLGPTKDDITARACAKALNKPLVLSQQAHASMQAYFDRRGFALTPDNEKQAWLPLSADVLVNDHGTAPGFCFLLHQCWFFCMPGVPSEMKQMMETLVVPNIQKTFSLKPSLYIRRLTVFGLHESKVGSLLDGFDDKFPGIRLGFRASFPTIEVKLVYDAARGGNTSIKEPQAYLAVAGQWVEDQLKNKVVSVTGLSLEAEVGRLLIRRGQTLSVAESCTGGLISHLITEVPGSSDYLLLSAVTYANTAKTKILNVNPNTLETHGAVHETTALEMAAGARQISGSDWAVSTTGIAGPGGGPTQKTVGTVCIGLAGPGVATSQTHTFRFDDRSKNKKMFAAMALETLRRHLAEKNGEQG